MSRQPPQRDVAPVVSRVRLRYSKGGRLRFASHRDFQRSLERAVRRARLPIAYSAGFSPHPRISYTNSVPTGAGSDAEYVELGLTREVAPDEVAAGLNDALPDGFRIRDAVLAGPGALANRLEASRYEVVLTGVGPEQAAAAVDDLLGRGAVTVRRITKKGARDLDVRSALLHLAAAPGTEPGTDRSAPDDAGDPGPAQECAILHMVVRQMTPAVRPNDVLTALTETSGLAAPRSTRIWRRSQGPLGDDGLTIGDPLAADRSLVSGT